ncbi:putative nuclease HARBI1 [Teleopsis dalmanni]|uniref:putative nuclease HARBI1 n=1 Tax=Teleopsis dalmanni TaxID=139649 RepID=UPI0018CEF9F9|nr:putative nuclease HARBI1 [Teleopsis dalmanni]
MSKVGKPKKKQRMWSNDFLLERSMLSNEDIITKLKKTELKELEENLNMPEEVFNYLLDLIKPHISKKDTIMRNAITAEERLAVTLRFLYSGMDYSKLKLIYKISAQAIARIVPETCLAIFKTLKNEYLRFPQNEKEWREIAEGFHNSCQFENCIGAIACKHVPIQRPPQSLGQFTNHEGTCSIILCGIVNSNYDFIYIHEGVNGSVVDGEVYLRGTEFFDKWLDDDLNIPDANRLQKSNFVCPYGFVGDETFALSENLWTPYPIEKSSLKEEVFNYRLNRARQVVEDTFGHLISKFKVFQKPLRVKLEHLDPIILGTCTLHNFLKAHSVDYMTAEDVDVEDLERGIVVPGAWRKNKELLAFEKTKIDSMVESKELRDKLRDYYWNEGKVPFQYKMINSVKEE